LKTEHSIGTWHKAEDGRVSITEGDRKGKARDLELSQRLIFFEASELSLYFRADARRDYSTRGDESADLKLIKTRSIDGLAKLTNSNNFGILSKDGHVRRWQNKLNVSIEQGGEKPGAILILHHAYDTHNYDQLETFNAFMTFCLPEPNFGELWDFVRQNQTGSLAGAIEVPFLDDGSARHEERLMRKTFYFREAETVAAAQCTVIAYQEPVSKPQDHGTLGDVRVSPSSPGPVVLASTVAGFRMNRVSRVTHRLGIILAVPLLVIALLGTALNLNTRWRVADLALDKFNCALHSAQKPWSCDPVVLAPDEEIARTRNSNSGLPLLVLIAGAGVGLYGACRAIGWVINGWGEPT
jgi:hypothetical protein